MWLVLIFCSKDCTVSNMRTHCSQDFSSPEESCRDVTVALLNLNYCLCKSTSQLDFPASQISCVIIKLYAKLSY